MRLTPEEVFVIETYKEHQPHSSNPLWWVSIGWTSKDLTMSFSRVLVYDDDTDKILINVDNQALNDYVMSQDPL